MKLVVHSTYRVGTELVRNSSATKLSPTFILKNLENTPSTETTADPSPLSGKKLMTYGLWPVINDLSPMTMTYGL